MAIQRRRDLPPKLQEMATKPWVGIVHDMIDKDKSIREIQKFLKSQNYSLSKDYVSIYRRYYKAQGVETQNLHVFLHSGKVTDMAFNKNEDRVPLSRSDKLKYDMEYIDLVIQAGAENLAKKIEVGEEDILRPVDVFKAIEIKDKLTEGATGGLTNYGLIYLQELTEAKYMYLMEVLFEYIPEEKRVEVMNRLEDEEDMFYQETDYYEDYLRAKGMTEKEISDALYEKELNKTNDTKAKRKSSK